MKNNTVVSLFAMLALADVYALRINRAVSVEKKKTRHDAKRRRPLLRTSLKSLASAARESSTWGDHISPSGRGRGGGGGASSRKHNVNTKKQYKSTSTSMTKSSSIFITKLHNKIQKQRHQNPKKASILQNEKTKTRQRYNYLKEEHFIQEILALIATGAAATSAFVAVTSGAFVATLAIAVGSVVTVLFQGDTENDYVTDANFNETTDKITNDDDEEEEVIIGEDCDISGDHEIDTDAQQSNKMTLDQEARSQQKLTDYTLNELRRCYNGKQLKTPFQFSHRHDDICIVHEISEEEECSDCDATVTSDIIVDAIEGACSAGECEKLMPSLPSESTKRVNVVWHDPLIADNARNALKKAGRAQPRGKERWTRSLKSQHDIEDKDDLTDAEGAMLISQSFRVAASAFGVVANAVRFTGETAAVATGGTARLAGGVFRLSGWAVNSLGTAIEHGGAMRDDISQAEDPHSGKRRTSKRKVAGESVRLLGESIEQVADSLLLAGSATERVAFAVAGVAEGAVRFVEDIALSASDAFARESRKALTLRSTPKEHDTPESGVQDDHHLTDQITTPEASLVLNEVDGSSLIGIPTNDDHDNVSDFFVWASTHVEDIMADTVGVGSLAPELLGVFVACYLASLVLLYRHRGRDSISNNESEKDKPMHISIEKQAPYESLTHDTHNDTDSHTTLTADWTLKAEKRATVQNLFSFLKHLTTRLLFVILLPMKSFILTVGWAWNVAVDRKTVLLILYSICFFFLSGSSQYKAAVIKRKSELVGYHDALASIGRSSSSFVESLMWVNTIMATVWRVNDETKTSPYFGGLEPYLSSVTSASLEENLSGSYKKPSGVAHVSLNSFTLGKTPPIIRGIEVLRVDNHDPSAPVVYMTTILSVLMELELLLDVSPSSLEYKMVPKTTLSVNSLDAELTLDLSLTSRPSYPYISHVNVSLSHEIPDFSLRIEPRSQSGLKGVDFGNFPILSKWIKDSIFESLREYVTPSYISIDIPGWLNGAPTIISYF